MSIEYLTKLGLDCKVNGMNAVEPEVASKNFALLICPIEASAARYNNIPFDLYCPSIQNKLKEGIWPKCQHYWPSQAAMKRYMKCHKLSAATSPALAASAASTASEEEEQKEKKDDDKLEITTMEERMPVFDNIFDVFLSPFS